MDDDGNFRMVLTPKTFKRVQLDVEYRNCLTAESLKNNGSIVPKMVIYEEAPQIQQEPDYDFEPINSLAPDDSEMREKSTEVSQGKETWLEAPTKLLLSLLEELQPKVGTTFALKNKGKMWQQIQIKLQEKGYSFTVSQVQGKYRSLERRYKQTKLNNSKTGRNRMVCPFESELDKILGNKKAVNPEYILDSETSNLTSEDFITGFNEASTSSYSAIDETDAPRLKRRKPNYSEVEQSKQEYREKQLLLQQQFIDAIVEKNRIERERNIILKQILEKEDLN